MVEGAMNDNMPDGWKYNSSTEEYGFYIKDDDVRPVIKASKRRSAVMIRSDVKGKLPKALVERQQLIGLALLRGGHFGNSNKRD
jgi:hypothetical protein